MQTQFTESVHRSVLPEHVRNKLKIDAEYFRVSYEVDEEANMPPEEDFTPEFIKAVAESEKDFREGRYIHCKTKEESKALFESLWNEE